MRTPLRLMLLGVLAATMVGCVLAPKVTLYNNTRQTLQVVADRSVHRIGPWEKVTFRWPAGDYRNFLVISGDCVRRYALSIPFPGDEFMSPGLFAGHMRVQYMPDGLLWALRPDDMAFMAPKADQPEQYPLIPQPCGACEE